MAPAQEHALAALVLLAVLGMAIYRLVLWITEAPRTPDVWGKEVEDAVNDVDAVPVCPRCLAPQKHNRWFCPECGATVGAYCNYMPYVVVFSEGQLLRAGITERIRRSVLLIVGFMLLPLAVLALAAPVYWFFLMKNLQRSSPAQPEPSASG